MRARPIRRHLPTVQRAGPRSFWRAEKSNNKLPETNYFNITVAAHTTEDQIKWQS
jgi:hypothetical protein